MTTLFLMTALCPLSLADAAVPAATAKIAPKTLREADIQSSSMSIVITLKGAKWNKQAVQSASAVSALLRGFKAQSEPDKLKLWQSAKPKLTLADDYTLSLDLPAIQAYDIVRDQEIQVTIPRSLTTYGADISAGDIVVYASFPPYTIPFDEAMRSNTLAYWLGYTSPDRVFIYVPYRHIDTITIYQQPMAGGYVTIIDVVTDSEVESVSATWSNIEHISANYTQQSDGSRKFSIGFAEVPPGANVAITPRDRYAQPLQKEAVKKVNTAKKTEYKEQPKTPIGGWYSLYQLTTDSKLLSTILSYYAPSELKAGAY